MNRIVIQSYTAGVVTLDYQSYDIMPNGDLAIECTDGTFHLYLNEDIVSTKFLAGKILNINSLKDKDVETQN